MEEEALFVNEKSHNVEDPVVSEMPVFLNNNAGENLILLQYPTRRQNQAYKVSQVRLKPISQVIETDLNLSVPSRYIDESKGSTAQGLTQKFAGVLKDGQGRFAAGYVHDGALHISLVPQVGQLRPKFASQSPTVLQPVMVQANSQAKAKDQGLPALRSVQMSVKSSAVELPKHSGVLEFWRSANKEEAVDYEPENLEETQVHKLLALNDQSEQKTFLENLEPPSMIFL